MRDQRRRRRWRWVKRAGLGLGAAMLAVTVASRWWSVEASDIGRFDVTIASGQMLIIDFARYKGRRQFTVDVVPTRPRGLMWWFDWNQGDPRFPPYWAVPLWSLAAAALLVALVAWKKQGRDPSACRGCGYDRTGLAPEAVCPECGRRPGRAADRSATEPAADR